MTMRKSRQFGCESSEAKIRELGMQKAPMILLAFALMGNDPAGLLAQGTMSQSGPLFEHPVAHPATSRSAAGNWRTSVGAWGENFADQTLSLRGFNQIHEIKHGSNNGIDRIAVKRGVLGRIKDVRFVEVKTTRSSKPKLGQTRYGGKQMSRRWLAANLRIMRNSGDPALKKLALDISRFRKAAGVPIESLGEVMHVNTRTGKLTGYAADGRTMRYSQSIERNLKNIQSRAGSKTARNWATRHLAQYDQIRARGMSDYLVKTVAQQSKRSIVSASSQNLRAAKAARTAVLRQLKNELASTIIKRSSGRIAIFVAVIVDAKEIFDVEYAYRNGSISARQRNIRLASTVGGMIGAFAGASTGAIAGAWIGGFGGPVAWITVPAGGFLGGVIGGIGGYLGGSAVGAYGATAWYDSIDETVRDKFELSWLNSNGISK